MKKQTKAIKAMINAYQAAGDVPSAYGLDVGIERDGRTLLVEVNDALCLGNYGISPSLAASMFCARWRDIFLNPLAKKRDA